MSCYKPMKPSIPLDVDVGRVESREDVERVLACMRIGETRMYFRTAVETAELRSRITQMRTRGETK